MLGSAHPLVRPGKTGDDARVVGIQSDMPMGFGHTQLDVWAVDPSNPHRRELLNRVNMDGEEFVRCDARNHGVPRDTARHGVKPAPNTNAAALKITNHTRHNTRSAYRTTR